jgi:hypothetical protein
MESSHCASSASSPDSGIKIQALMALHAEDTKLPYGYKRSLGAMVQIQVD